MDGCQIITRHEANHKSTRIFIINTTHILLKVINIVVYYYVQLLLYISYIQKKIHNLL